MVLLALSPCLIKTWRNPQPRMISRWVAYAYMCGFLFGWHVHEKASLHFVIPLAIVAVQSIDDARHFFIISIGTVEKYQGFFLLPRTPNQRKTIVKKVYNKLPMLVNNSVMFSQHIINMLIILCILPNQRNCRRTWLVMK